MKLAILLRSTPLFAVLVLAGPAAAKCIPIEDVPKNIGKETCVKGKVVRVAESRGGNTFLNFCDDYKTCPFAVVVFERDQREVGNVKKLEGKEIRIWGRIQEYEGRPEMVLKRSQQLTGEPPPDTQFDAQDRRGERTPRPSGRTPTRRDPPQ